MRSQKETIDHRSVWHTVHPRIAGCGQSQLDRHICPCFPKGWGGQKGLHSSLSLRMYVPAMPPCLSLPTLLCPFSSTYLPRPRLELLAVPQTPIL